MSLSLRDSWREAWLEARCLAVEALAAADLEERCRKSGASWRAGMAELSWLGRRYQIRPPGFEVCRGDMRRGDMRPGDMRRGDGEEVDLREQVLLLHYLQTAGGAPLVGEWVSFAHLPGGERYQGNFQARGADRVVRRFGGCPADLVAAAAAVGGHRAEGGDAAAVVPALPRVPVLVVVWRGDEEFGPSGSFLFDASVGDYLSTEDAVVLGGALADRLLAASVAAAVAASVAASLAAAAAGGTGP